MSILSINCTDHSAYTTWNLGAGGIRELTQDANKIEQMYRSIEKRHFSTTFVAHSSSVLVLLGPLILARNISTNISTLGQPTHL